MNLHNFDWHKPNVLLINFGLEALGVRQLASFLKKSSCKVNILFLHHGIDDKQANLLANFIDYNNYNVVGFSCMTGDYYEIKLLSQFIKLSKNRPLIIWGGVHPTILPEECLFEGGADLVFNAAAEIPLAKLLTGSPLIEVPNIAWIDHEELITNYTDVTLYPPDSMPFPDFEFNDHFVIKDNKIVSLDTKIFRERYPWKGTHYYGITARGCPYHCAYCCNIYHGKFLRKSVDYFMEELSYIGKKLPFFSTLSIQDDSLFMNEIRWINDFSEKYKRKINKPLRAALMPKFGTNERLKPLAEAGLTYIGIGLQGSSRLNKEIYGRKESSESFLQAVYNYKKLGIVGRIDVIVDNPYEQEDDLLEIANTLNEIPKPFAISVFTLTLFRGTKMTTMAERDGMAHLFAGDPYVPGLDAGKYTEGKYRTPEHYKTLFKDYLPNLPRKYCKYLISNIKRMDTQQQIIRYSRWPQKVRKIGTKLREMSPRLFDRTILYFNKRLR